MAIHSYPSFPPYRYAMFSAYLKEGISLEYMFKGEGEGAMTVSRVNANEIMRAKQVDLLSYLEAKGEKFKKEGNYYRHMEHDSLIIRDNMYAWNSKGLKGQGAINFAKDFYGLSFVEAVRELSSGNYPTINREKQQEVKQTREFQYPEFLEVKDHTTIKRYLVHERKIDSRIVDWLIRKDLIAQDQKNNVVFKWRENGGKGQIVGAERQGTVKIANKRGSFKQILSNSKKGSGAKSSTHLQVISKFWTC